MNHLKTFEKFSKNDEVQVQYDKSGLANPDKADLDKNKKINRYEKKRGKAIEKSIKKRKKSV
jgi:hypothetical protein